MYVLGIAALLALGIFALATVADRYLSIARERWAVVLVGLGIGAAWMVDLNLWSLWGMEARAEWVGITLSGLILAGLALIYRGMGHLLTALTRKVSDEAESLEKEKGLRRVA